MSLQGRERQGGVGHPDHSPLRPACCCPLFNTALNPLPWPPSFHMSVSWTLRVPKETLFSSFLVTAPKAGAV